MQEADCLFKNDSLLGETPVWNEVKNILFWLDFLKGQIHTFDPKKNKDTFIQMDQPVTSLAMLKDGRFILTFFDRIVLFNPENNAFHDLFSLGANSKENRFSDGKCDQLGRFWCSTLNMKNPKKNSGVLYRVDVNSSVDKVEEGIVAGNGLGWSPDNKRFYFVHTHRHTVFVYDFDIQVGSLKNPRPFLTFAANIEPDGLTVDSEGFVWVALYGVGQVVRVSPKGEIERTVSLPAPHVTSCTFGGEQLETLFITTAQENMSKEELKKFPLSGSLFALKPGVKGLPSSYFAGG